MVYNMVRLKGVFIYGKSIRSKKHRKILWKQI